MKNNTIELIFMIVAIVFLIVATVGVLKQEKKLMKFSIEKLKKRLRSDVCFAIFLLIIGGLVCKPWFHILFSNTLQITNAFLWMFLMGYFHLLDIFVTKRCIKTRQKEQAESESYL